MPTYEYQSPNPNGACELCRARFEVQQSIHAAALEACPRCGGPVARQISLCGISTSMSERAMLSDKHLKEKGFTKLVNEGEGRFRRVT